MVLDELGLFPDHGDIVIANPLVASLSGRAESPLLVLDNIPPTRLNLRSTASLNFFWHSAGYCTL